MAGEALFVRICLDLLEFAAICWNLLEFAGIYWNLLEFTGIYQPRGWPPEHGWRSTICLNLLTTALATKPWLAKHYLPEFAHHSFGHQTMADEALFGHQTMADEALFGSMAICEWCPRAIYDIGTEILCLQCSDHEPIKNRTPEDFKS